MADTIDADNPFAVLIPKKEDEDKDNPFAKLVPKSKNPPGQRQRSDGALEVDIGSGPRDEIGAADRAARRSTHALTMGLGNYLGDALTAGKNVITGQAESFPEEYS